MKDQFRTLAAAAVAAAIAASGGTGFAQERPAQGQAPDGGRIIIYADPSDDFLSDDFEADPVEQLSEGRPVHTNLTVGDLRRAQQQREQMQQQQMRQMRQQQRDFAAQPGQPRMQTQGPRVMGQAAYLGDTFRRRSYAEDLVPLYDRDVSQLSRGELERIAEQREQLRDQAVTGQEFGQPPRPAGVGAPLTGTGTAGPVGPPAGVGAPGSGAFQQDPGLPDEGFDDAFEGARIPDDAFPGTSTGEAVGGARQQLQDARSRVGARRGPIDNPSQFNRNIPGFGDGSGTGATRIDDISVGDVTSLGRTGGTSGTGGNTSGTGGTVGDED